MSHENTQILITDNQDLTHIVAPATPHDNFLLQPDSSVTLLDQTPKGQPTRTIQLKINKTSHSDDSPQYPTDQKERKTEEKTVPSPQIVLKPSMPDLFREEYNDTKELTNVSEVPAPQIFRERLESPHNLVPGDIDIIQP